MPDAKPNRKYLILGSIGLLLLVLAWVAYFVIEATDHQIANMTWTLLTTLGGLLVSIWLLALQRNIYWRLTTIASIFALCGIFLATSIEFRGFSGELIPQFRWKGSLKEVAIPALKTDANDQGKAKVDSSDAVTKSTASPQPSNSFRQFMGNHRNGIVDGVTLRQGWKETPPVILWEIALGPAWSGFVVDQEIAVTQEEFEGRDAVVALSLASGKILWRSTVDRKHYNPLGGAGPRATPTIDGGLVFCQSSTGIVTSHELTTGKVNWSVDLLNKAGIDQPKSEDAIAWGRSGSPLIVEDMVIVPFGSAMPSERKSEISSLIALNRSTGEEVWRGGDSQISYASPSLLEISGNQQIVIVNESNVSGYEVRSGKLLWSTPWPGSSKGPANVSQATLLDPRHLFLSKGYGGGSKLLEFPAEFKSNKIEVLTRWANATIMKTKFMTPVFRNGYIYGLSDGILECIRGEDGMRQWKDSKDGRLGHGQIVLVGEHLLCSSEDGRLVLTTASPTKPTQYDSLQLLEGITWNPLAIVDDLVLVRNSEKGVCVRVPISRTNATNPKK